MTTSNRSSQPPPRVVAVVGSSSTFGALLLAHLESEWPNCQFVTIDTQPLRWPVKRVSAYRMDRRDGGEILHIDDIPEVMQSRAWDMILDTRRPTMADIPDVLHLETVDSVIHVGSHYDGPGQEQFLNNTAYWIRMCRAAGVRQLVYLSDIRVYGINRDNSIPLTERSSPNPAQRHRLLLEAEPDPQQSQNPTPAPDEMSVAVLRAAMTLGPSGSSPIADELLFPSIMASKRKPNIPLQFLHQQDLVRAAQYAITQRLDGVYNVASNGIVASRDVMELCRPSGLSGLPKPPRARRVGRRRLARQPLIVTSTKFRQAAGVPFKYTSGQAIRAYCHSCLLGPGSHNDR